MGGGGGIVQGSGGEVRGGGGVVKAGAAVEDGLEAAGGVDPAALVGAGGGVDGVGVDDRTQSSLELGQ